MTSYEPEQQLELLRKQCELLSPIIYRDQALYLQIARKLLFDVVKKAIFELIASKDNNIVPSLEGESSKSFQQKIDNLVERCLSLMTIEHLMDLARQIENEIKQRQQRAKEELLLSLDSNQKASQFSLGSVELSLYPPIENPEYLHSAE